MPLRTAAPDTASGGHAEAPAAGRSGEAADGSYADPTAPATPRGCRSQALATSADVANHASGLEHESERSAIRAQGRSPRAAAPRARFVGMHRRWPHLSAIPGDREQVWRCWIAPRFRSGRDRVLIYVAPASCREQARLACLSAAEACCGVLLVRGMLSPARPRTRSPRTGAQRR